MRQLFSGRHNWQAYQILIRLVKYIVGKQLFYAIRNLPENTCILFRRIRVSLSDAWLRIQEKKKPQIILIVDHGIPKPDTNSGDRRIVEIIRVLQRMGYIVHFLAFDNLPLPSYEQALEAENVTVIHKELFPHLKEKGGLYTTIMLCRVIVAVHSIDTVRRFAPQASVLFDTVDLHHKRLERKEALNPSEAGKEEARWYREQEFAVMKQTDCTLVVSAHEQKYLNELLPEVKVFLVSNIMETRKKAVWTKQRQHLLFIGNFYHQPNRDALCWFAESILPIIQRQLPDIQLDVLGEYPAADMDFLESKAIVLHGYQPFVEPFFDRVRVSVAPIRFGAGIKGKLHMSMSEGVPFVTTSVGAEGMFLTQGKDAIIADTAEEFAAGVIRVWQDKRLWLRMTQASQRTLRTHFSASVAQKELLQMFIFLHSRKKKYATLPV